MKMNLNLTERMRLMVILPQEDSFFNLRAIRKLKEAIALKEDGSEDSLFGVVRTDEMIRWSPEKAKIEKEYEVGEVAFEMIKKKLKSLDEEKKLVDVDITLYEKFVEGKPSDPANEA